MARNRTIYQTEAIYVSDNTRSITKSEHKNISRVQSANYGFSINRERVNQYGQLGEIDSIVVEAPNVDFEMSYYLTNGDNEYFLNLDTGYGGFLKNQIISSGQNIYVVNVPEGKDVQDQNWDNFSVIGIGNAFVTDYTVDFGVGQMSRVNVGFSALNISSQINLSKVSGELIGIENAGINPISGVKYTDPITIAPIVNNSGQSAIRPSDTSITITPTKTLGDNDSISVLSTLDEKAHIQTASLNIALDRTSLQRLGSNFAYAKVVEPPTTATVSISAIVNETQSSSLSDILDHSNEYTIEIESVDPDGYQLCKYSLVGAKLDSESFGSAIGSNKVVDLTFTTQLGGIGQTNYNMFFEKYGFLDFFPSASAAYSLRNLTADFDQKIVRVRRESDNSERDFTEYDIKNGTMVDWVNKQVIRPLDIRELDDANGNRPDTNDFIDTPAAAYSLRSLGENQANITINDSNDERDGETGKYVVQTRRNVDGATKSFTADEVTDGTLESFVEGWEEVTQLVDKSSFRRDNLNFTYVDSRNFTFDFNADIGFDYDLLSFSLFKQGKHRVTFDLTVNEGTDGDTLTNRRFYIAARDGYGDNFYTTNIYDLQEGFNDITLTSKNNLKDTHPKIFFQAAYGTEVNFDITISNLKVYESTVNELPLDQATGAAAAYSLRNLKASGTDVTATESFSFTGADGESATHNGELFIVNGTRDGKPEYSTANGNAGIHWSPNFGGYWVLYDYDLSSVTARSSYSTDDYPWQATWGGQGIGDDDDLNNATFNTNTGKYVVQTRRSSDDAVQSFTASEVANGTLEDWVNADVDKLDLGAKAAGGGLSGNYTNGTDSADFSVSNEGSTGYGYLLDNSDVGAGSYEITFDVVLNSGSLSGITIVINDPTNYQYQDIVSGSNSFSGTIDNAGSIFFRTSSTSIADVSITNITLTQTTANGFVRTWYDQSGSDNHAVQTTPANQPKIVEGGTLVADGIDFDGTDDFLSINFGAALSQPNSIFMVHTSDTASDTKNEFFDSADGAPRTLLDQSGAYYRMLASTSQPTSLTIDANQKTLVGAFYNTTSSFLSKNGTASLTLSVGTAPIDSTSNIGYSQPSGNYYDGSMDEFIIYDSDQSTKRRAIEENIANHYDISLAASSRDGTVSTWYDQSGNTNDATQTDPTKQPKIVDGGTLLTDGVKFDGADDGLRYDGLVLTSGTFFSTSVVTHADGTNTAQGQIYGQYPGNGRWYLTAEGDDQYQFFASCDVENLIRAYGYIPSATKLLTAQGDGSNFIGFSDGLNIGSDTYDTFNPAQNNRDFTIGFDHDGTRPFDGSVAEIIIYNSDQSANRKAIEANIGETYGITSIPAVDNTVNGFVQTWYEQSGEGNDAVQNTASYQPKIVDSGALVTRNINGTVSPSIKFGASNNMYHGITSLSADGQQSLFFVADNQITSGDSTRLLEIMSSTEDEGRRRRPLIYKTSSQTIVFSVDTLGGIQVTASNSDQVSAYSSITNDTSGGTHTVYQDGTQVGSATVTLDANPTLSTSHEEQLGHLASNAVGNFYFTEIVYYNSDQSSNRTAIETNIANHYGITLS